MEPAISILLVEDEALVALSLQEAREEGGYTVLIASAGAEALGAIDGRDQISGIITDIGWAMDPTAGRWLVMRARNIPDSLWST